MKTDFKNKRVTVIGLARSGVAAALTLQQRGARVFGSDNGAVDSARLKTLRDSGIGVETGGHTGNVFAADLFIVSPGVPLTIPVIAEARRRAIPVWSEIELAYLLTDSDIVGVTGSNGKSTTTALLGELFKKASCRSAIGGNIGEALTGQMEGLGRGDVLIAELSSFQLDAVETFRPRAAAVLNLTPDHLDRYPSADHYYASKLSITRNQTEEDLLVLNGDDPITQSKLGGLRTRAEVALFSLENEVSFGTFVRDGWIVSRNGKTEKRIVRADEVGLIGRHNLANILAAAAIADRYAIASDAVAEVLRTFKGIEHRIEFVRTLNGVTYYNDSKGTNVDSVRWALLGLKTGIHLIAGGRDKAGDFTALNDLVMQKVTAVYAIGEAAEKISKAWSGFKTVLRPATMDEAVALASRSAKAGESVLLSPACASFDMYKNYEERGRHFKRLVEAL